MKAGKKILLTILTVATLGSSFASAFALYGKSANCIDVSITGDVYHKITYYLPNPSDENDFETLSEKTIYVTEGTALKDVSFIKESSINGFEFSSWYTSSDFASVNKLEDTSVISGDLEIYAKYTRSNVLYFYNDAHNYLINTPIEDQILTQNQFFVGTQTYAKAGVEGEAYSLTSESGVYKFELNGNEWSCKRKIVISNKDVTWWVNDVTKLWCFGSTSLSDSYTSQITFEDNKATLYVDYSYTGFVLDRFNPDNLEEKRNQTIDISLTADSGEGKYTKDTTIIYVNDAKIDDKNKYYWGS